MREYQNIQCRRQAPGSATVPSCKVRPQLSAHPPSAFPPVTMKRGQQGKHVMHMLCCIAELSVRGLPCSIYMIVFIHHNSEALHITVPACMSANSQPGHTVPYRIVIVAIFISYVQELCTGLLQITQPEFGGLLWCFVEKTHSVGRVTLYSRFAFLHMCFLLDCT